MRQTGKWERTRAKKTTDEYGSIDIRVWYRAGLLRDGASFRWRSDGHRIMPTIGVWMEGTTLFFVIAPGQDARREQTVSLSWSACPYGGMRPWFECPSAKCTSRVALLYYAGSHFACRHCLKLAYQSQRLDRVGRLCRNAERLRERLGDVQADIPAKPRGMHRSTYERLRGRLIRLELVAWDIFDDRLNAYASLL